MKWLFSSVILFTLSYFFFTSSNITLLKKKIEETYTVCDLCFTSRLVVIFQLFHSIWSLSALCTQMRITEQSSARGKSSAMESLCVYAITTIKRTWEQGWSSPLCIIFFRFWRCGYFTDGPRMALPQPKQKHMQGLSQNEACSVDIGTQYWTDLHGIALKNNELNVVMADIRHWKLVLICILYAPW